VRWRGLLVCAIDGTIMSVPDSPANLTRFTKQRGGATGGSSYPMLRLLAVVACGTRTVIDAVFGSISSGETTYARQLVGSLRAGMLVLADRNFAAGWLLAAVAETGAHLLVRAKTGSGGPHLPVLRRHRDGSYRSTFGGKLVRVVEAEITTTNSVGTATGVYRLITTLLDQRRHPAAALVRLYHERWEIETAYLEPAPAWIPTGQASPSPCTPPVTRSCRLQASSPTPLSISSARSAVWCWTTCCPTGGYASTPAPSNEQSPNTTPEARTSTGAPTKPPSPSTSSPVPP
jgi:hypothetical protein